MCYSHFVQFSHLVAHISLGCNRFLLVSIQLNCDVNFCIYCFFRWGIERLSSLMRKGNLRATSQTITRVQSVSCIFLDEVGSDKVMASSVPPSDWNDVLVHVPIGQICCIHGIYDKYYSRSATDIFCQNRLIKVSKGAKITNWYKQVPHLTQDTTY